MRANYIICFLIITQLLSSAASAQSTQPFRVIKAENIQVGAERSNKYFPLLEGKRIAVVANQTSFIGKTHIVDSLQGAGLNVVKVFCPEHGFRGQAGAGEDILDDTDKQSGLKIVSLYGSKKKPDANDLSDVDIVLFDIQDVGVRFYTYVSTMTYVMEACAENGTPCIILDRPNPNGHYIDGPVLKPAFRSFVGMHQVPVVHGMTLAEYARMVNGEGWLKDGIKCDLMVIPVRAYTHSDLYQLPIAPSPNLPNMSAVSLYPSLAFFEGTDISVARGTDFPFQAFGHPDIIGGFFSFTPKSRQESPKPPHQDKVCNGYDLREFGEKFIRNYRQLYLFWIIETYRDLGGSADFFNTYFDKLAGTDELRIQIVGGMTESQIRESWQKDLGNFKQIRKKYLLYPDFE